jgi:hypothetical protein
MDQIRVENVRCFYEQQQIPLKPVTFLIGENSTGKSTFLALTRIAWQLCQSFQVDFNEEPFLLGVYDQIASYHGGRGGRADSFTIGSTIALRSRLDSIAQATITSRFVRTETQPLLRQWELDAGEFHIEVHLPEAEGRPTSATIRTPSGSMTISGQDVLRLPGGIPFLTILPFIVRETAMTSKQKLPPGLNQQTLERLGYELMRSIGRRPYAIAPIRTRPQRTYDPMRDAPTPEGFHVPMVLAKASSDTAEEWQQLRDSLNAFGASSGLFTQVKVQRMGRKPSDPFQIRIKVAGPAFNLVDVGYGVSQVLPIVVDSLRQPEGTTFLLQQPEVHLHPRAQAELGTFLALVARQQNKRFLIETHSDYILDRVRMDIRTARVLRPEDVAILYFERHNGNVTIYPLQVDASGNIVGAPPSYRRFFLEEERRLLGA